MRWNEERTEPRRRLRSAAATLLSALVFVSGLPAEAAALSEPSGESPEEHLRGTSEVVLSDAEETAPTVLGEEAREVNAQPSEETSVPHEDSSEEVNSLAAAPSAIPEESEAVDLTQWGAIPGDPKTEWEAQLGRAREEAARLDPATLDGVPLARAYSRGSLSESIIPDFALNGLTSRGLDASWFAYTKAGEQLTVHLWAYPQPVRDNDPNYKARVTLTSPSGSSETRTIERAASSPQFVKTSTQEGVWKITIRDATPPTPIIRDLTPADIRVTTSGGREVTGRVWAERMAVDQTSIRTPRIWAMSPRGVIYQITQPGYDGVSSTWTMNNVGIHLGGPSDECEPAFGSRPELPAIGADAATSGPAYTVPADRNGCVGLETYRLFPDMPARDIPATIANWADNRGTAHRWGYTEYQAPRIANLAATRTTPGTNQLRITGALQRQPATVTMWIDTNGNGVYNPSVDVQFRKRMLKPGTFSFDWNGRNAAGAVVPTTQSLRAYASFSEVSPIHFTREDVEQAGGGIEIRAIRGGTTGPLRLYWDDSYFNHTSSGRTSTTSPRSSLNGTMSTGGVHGWSYGGTVNDANRNNGTNGSWGDRRVINDWAFLEENGNAPVEIPIPGVPELKVWKRQVGNPVIAADNSSATVTWDVTVTNVASGEAGADGTGVVVRDILPAGASNVTGVTVPNGTTFSASTRTWTIGTLARNNQNGNAAASTRTLRLSATIPIDKAALPANLTNRVIVNATELPERVPSGNCQMNGSVAADTDRCDEAVTQITPPVLKIDKRVALAPVYSADRRTAVIEWDVTVRNVATGANAARATNVRLTDLFPTTATNISSPSRTKGTFNGATGVWTVGQLVRSNAAGDNVAAEATIRLRATLSTGTVGQAAAQVTRTNRAIVNADELSSRAIGGVCQINTTVAADNDRCDEVSSTLQSPIASQVKIDKAQVGEPDYNSARTRATITWDITVKNVSAGASYIPATGVVVEDLLPAGASNLTVVSTSQGIMDTSTRRWAVGTLAVNNGGGTNPASQATVRLSASVPTAAMFESSIAVNRAIVNTTDLPPRTIDGPCQENGTVDADTDRCDQVLTPLEGPKPAWTSAKTSDPASGEMIGLQQDITYTLTATNTGDVPLEDLVMHDDLSEVLNSAVLKGDLPGGIVQDPEDPAKLTWTVPTVPVDGEVTVSYTVTVNQDATSRLIRNSVHGEGIVPPAACVEDAPCVTEHETPEWPEIQVPVLGGSASLWIPAGAGVLALLGVAIAVVVIRKRKQTAAAEATL